MSLAQASVEQSSAATPATCAGLTSWQLMLFVIQPLLLLAAAWWSWATQEAFFLLFTESLGQKMLVQASTYLALNAVALSAGCWLLNRFCAEHHLVRHVLTSILHAGCCLLLFMPAVWVLIVGPAAVNVLRTLAL
ncbi:MAG: hypothetical protein L0Y71_12890 [Gemmataceae bacterium]|nr:hypothetical protein [Gemmataceae bacterium]